MKRSILYLSFFACSSWIVFSGASGGRAAGGQDRTGSPVSTGTCGGCHSGGTFGSSVTATLKDAGSNVVTSYIPGDTYTLEIQVSNSTGSPTGYGAQAVALLSGNAQAGSFTAVGATNQVSVLSGLEYPEHMGIDADGFFEYSWVAPAASSGDVVLYAIGNVINGSGSTAGDEPSAPITVTFTEAAAPACSAPTNLTVTNITGTTADLSWTTGGSAIWESQVVLAGVTPTDYGVATVTTTESLSSLSPGTNYDVYVRDVCSASLMIAGVYDGPLTGGEPKGVELYAVNDIADLSSYGLGSANNGGGTDGQEFTFPAVSVAAGTSIYISSDTAMFSAYMGFSADYQTAFMQVNGDDAVELFIDGTVIDVYGDINTDGTGETWEFLDGWAYRNNGEVNNMGVFDDSKWTYSGPNATDGCGTNVSCGSIYPNGTFTTTSDVSAWTGPESFMTPCVTITLNSTVNDITCNGNTDGSVILAPSGGGTSYSYSWSNSATTASISGLVAGNYDVTVNYGSCSVTDSYTITEPAALMITATSTDATCNGASDGSVSVTASGGETPYSFSWSNGATTPGFGGCPAYSLGITVTDNSGCTAVGTSIVSEPSAITITNTINTSVSCNGVCDGGATNTAAGGTTPYTYMWNSGESVLSVTGLCGGTADMSVTDGNGCPANLSITIAEPAAFSLTVSVTDATTAGGSDGDATAIVGTPSNYTYVWNNGGQTTQMVTGLMAGTASVTVTLISTGCSQMASGVVADPAACNITLTSTPTNVNCNGGSDGMIMVSTVGGPSTLYTYNWSSGGSSATETGLIAGGYSVTVNSGSCTATDALTLTEPLAITATDSIGVCMGDSVLLGGIYYNTAGFYPDMQLASNGCDSSITVQVTMVSGPNAGTDGSMDVCEFDLTGDLFDGLTGVLDSSGSWSTFFTTSTIFPISIGVDTVTYTYTLDDGLGTTCSIDSSVVTVRVHGSPDAGGNQTTSACVSAGTINLAPELNNPDAGGMWLDLDASGALTDSIFDASLVAIGNYDVAYSVPGNPGCVADTAVITVQIISTPNAGVGGVIEACDSETNIDPATGLTGSPDAGGTWNDDDGSGAFLFGIFSPFVAGSGSYDFTYIVSAAGCTSDSATVAINVNASPDAGADVSDTVCFDETNINLMSLLGGTPDNGGIWTDDNSTGALTGSMFDATVAGLGNYGFTYTVSNPPCVDASATVTLAVQVCVGITEVNDNFNVQLFPNPATDFVTIQLNGWDNEQVNVLVTSIDGRLIKSTSINTNNAILDFNNIGAGVYFVHLIQNDKSIAKQLIVE